jgi:hypothetical protein
MHACGTSRRLDPYGRQHEQQRSEFNLALLPSFSRLRVFLHSRQVQASSFRSASMSSIKSRYCYTRNGTPITDAAYQPCNNSTTHSACCGINHSGAGHTGIADDTCESNGLCANFEAFTGDNEGMKMYWRQGCTDPTWQSEYCLGQVCNARNPQDKNDNWVVQWCGDGKWCCGDKTCCGFTNSLFELAATVGQTSTSSSISASGTASTTGPATTDASAISTTAQSTALSTSSSTGLPAAEREGDGLSTGAKAGIGAGIAVVVILVTIIALLLLKLKRRRTAQETLYQATPQYNGEGKPETAVYEHKAWPVEMPTDSRHAELGGEAHAELAANKPPRGSSYLT